MLDVVKSRRVNDSAPKLVLNQVGVAKRPEIPVKEFATAVGQEPVLVLPFDPQLFGTAANNGQMLAEGQPNSPGAEGMRALAEFVTGRAVSPPAQTSALSLLPFLRTPEG